MCEFYWRFLYNNMQNISNILRTIGEKWLKMYLKIWWVYTILLCYFTVFFVSFVTRTQIEGNRHIKLKVMKYNAFTMASNGFEFWIPFFNDIYKVEKWLCVYFSVILTIHLYIFLYADVSDFTQPTYKKVFYNASKVYVLTFFFSVCDEDKQ